MSELWYRPRLDNGILQGVNWSDVRCHVIARGLSDHVRTGLAFSSVALVIFDSRFFPWPFDGKQSKLSGPDLRALTIWVANTWPDWSLQTIHITKLVTWLEVLSLADQQKTLQILREHYGLK